MIIECLTKRDGNTVVILGGRKYTFKDNPEGQSLCKVDYPEHIKRMLRFDGLYREHKGDIEPKKEETPQSTPTKVKAVKETLVADTEPKKPTKEEIMTKGLAKIEGIVSIKKPKKKGRPRRA